MKVKELIAELAKVDQETTVVASIEFEDGEIKFYPIDYITPGSITPHEFPTMLNGSWENE